jgi:hypothetical protein
MAGRLDWRTAVPLIIAVTLLLWLLLGLAADDIVPRIISRLVMAVRPPDRAQIELADATVRQSLHSCSIVFY